MTNKEINVTVENVEDVVKVLNRIMQDPTTDELMLEDSIWEEAEDMESQLYSEDQLRLENWIWKEVEDMKNGVYSDDECEQRSRVIEYIHEHEAVVLGRVSGGPTYVHFKAEITIESLLEYGSEFAKPNDFAKSYHAAIRKLQQTFKNAGYEFSEVYFTSEEDDMVSIIWRTNKPILFKDILDYPKSLMLFASLLSQLDICGLNFGQSYHLIGPFSDESEENCYVSEAFKPNYFTTYGNSLYHLFQDCQFDKGGYIIYGLDGKYRLALEEDIDERSLQLILQSGYHLKDNQLKRGLNGVIKAVGHISW